jgi:hypothetical protein
MKCLLTSVNVYMYSCKLYLLPSIKIQIDKYLYTIPNSDYADMLGSGNDICVLKLTRDTQNKHGTWLFGNPFLNSYY